MTLFYWADGHREDVHLDGDLYGREVIELPERDPPMPTLRGGPHGDDGIRVHLFRRQVCQNGLRRWFEYHEVKR